MPRLLKQAEINKIAMLRQADVEGRRQAHNDTVFQLVKTAARAQAWATMMRSGMEKEALSLAPAKAIGSKIVGGLGKLFGGGAAQVAEKGVARAAGGAVARTPLKPGVLKPPGGSKTQWKGGEPFPNQRPHQEWASSKVLPSMERAGAEPAAAKALGKGRLATPSNAPPWMGPRAAAPAAAKAHADEMLRQFTASRAAPPDAGKMFLQKMEAHQAPRDLAGVLNRPPVPGSVAPPQAAPQPIHRPAFRSPGGRVARGPAQPGVGAPMTAHAGPEGVMGSVERQAPAVEHVSGRAAGKLGTPEASSAGLQRPVAPQHTPEQLKELEVHRARNAAELAGRGGSTYTPAQQEALRGRVMGSSWNSTLGQTKAFGGTPTVTTTTGPAPGQLGHPAGAGNVGNTRVSPLEHRPAPTPGQLGPAPAAAATPVATAATPAASPGALGPSPAGPAAAAPETPAQAAKKGKPMSPQQKAEYQKVKQESKLQKNYGEYTDLEARYKENPGSLTTQEQKRLARHRSDQGLMEHHGRQGEAATLKEQKDATKKRNRNIALGLGLPVAALGYGALKAAPAVAGALNQSSMYPMAGAYGWSPVDYGYGSSPYGPGATNLGRGA